MTPNLSFLSSKLAAARIAAALVVLQQHFSPQNLQQHELNL
jgi:hypothetical protein